MLSKNEKEEEGSEKIDEAQLALEYMEKDKEKLKPNKNDFNKITYLEYEDVFKKNTPEIDFLYDYSKILGSENSDPKVIHWQLANLDRLFKYGIDISILKKRNDQQNLGIYKMSNIVENISYRLQKHGKLAPSIDIARLLPKRDEEQYQLNEEEEDEEDINIEDEDLNSKNEKNNNTGQLNEAPLNNNNDNNTNNEIKNIKIINDNDNINENNINNNISNINEKEKEKDENKNEEINNENKISIDLNKKATNNQNANNIYEDNFYDKNDPFIDDDLDNNSSEENELLYKLTLGYGNFSEQAIMNNLKKNTRNNSLKKKKKMKNLKAKRGKEKGKKSPNKKEKKRIGNKILISNKTKRKNDEEKEATNKKKKKININIDSIDNLTKEKIEEIFNSLKSEYDSDITTDHEKESFLRRNIKIIEELYKKNKTDFISFLSTKFEIDLEKTNVLIEYELFKSTLENKYSNLSKFLNKLYTLLKENGVMEINTMEQMEKYMETVPEIRKSLNHISDNIINYRDKFNAYMGKHYSDMYLINESLENFIPNIKERNIEYITKISSKFNEYEEKFKIKVKKDILISFIKNKYPNMDFSEDLNSDINNRKFSLESFIIYDIGNKIPVFFQVEKKNVDEEKEGNCIVDINTKNDDIDLANNNQENIVNNNDDKNIPNNESVNKIGNDSKIFQSLKMNENKLKIFSSKIKVTDEKIDENNINQNQA